MKKNHLLLFILLLGNLGLKAQETIDNPPYKFRNTALYRIEKVECTDQDTKIYLRTEFIPGWWVQFSKEEINLKDNLGNRYQPLHSREPHGKSKSRLRHRERIILFSPSLLCPAE